MTDMQRYGIHCTDWQFDVLPADDGLYVLASDAEAAIAAAEQRGLERGLASKMVKKPRILRSASASMQTPLADKFIEREQGYRDGQRDMLAKCIAAVEEKDAAGTAQGWDLHISDVLAALRALQEGNS